VTTAQIITAVLALMGGFGGLAAFTRSKSQNSLDNASRRKAEAEADGMIVQTARELIADVRREMDLKVTGLEREVARMGGRLDAMTAERDDWRDRALNAERTVSELQARVTRLEAQAPPV
jgi:chromosome segregation ATPase